MLLESSHAIGQQSDAPARAFLRPSLVGGSTFRSQLAAAIELETAVNETLVFVPTD